MLTVLPDGEAAASSSAARSVHCPAASAQVPSPGWASWASAVVLTVNVKEDACAALGSHAAVPAVSRHAPAAAAVDK
jgi:hypothetical protein